MNKIRLINLIFGCLLFLLIYYMVFFVKYPMENDFQQVIKRTLADIIYHQFKRIYKYNLIDIFIMSSMYLSLFIMPFVLAFVGLKKKVSLILLSICSFISLFYIRLLYLYIGMNKNNIIEIEKPFIPYIILCSVIAVIIIIQYIVNLFFYTINKRKRKEKME